MAVRKGQVASRVLLTETGWLVQCGHGCGARFRDGGSDLPLVHPGTVFCDLCLTQERVTTLGTRGGAQPSQVGLFAFARLEALSPCK